MEQIIVTIADIKKNRQYDLEVPTELEIEKLLDDIVQTLVGYEPDCTFGFGEVELYSPGRRKNLDRHKSLQEEYIHNGDYLILNPV